MNRYDALMQRLHAGAQILINGATGTEIERRGVPMVEHAWNGGGALTHPAIVREVHADYIACGAQIVISNTFSTSRQVLRDAGMEDQFAFLNRRGVELAVEARAELQAPQVLVAGGITHLAFTRTYPPDAELRSNLAEQAAIMASAGADLIMLEMMTDIKRMQIAVNAAQASGLPVWAGVSCRPDASGTMRLLEGPTLAEGLRALRELEIPLVSIMHTEVTDIDACLDVVAAEWAGITGVYAHSGRFVDPHWVFNDTIAPEAYAAAALGWKQRGVQLIGGCCGIGIEHIRALKDVVFPDT
jgi:S-methylmethionine-dependent homocysteine/selenocysteine methylase